jgi:AbrB family looped-hinge helix DNA binding protein
MIGQEATPMASETSVDRFGRVVIPKETRDHFGLEPGSALTVDEREDGILLRPASPAATLRVKKGVLVFAGDVTGDALEAVRQQRDRRIQRFFPRRKR